MNRLIDLKNRGMLWVHNHTLLLILVVSGIAHAVNMFGFPAYREDEGTYMSQAWAVLNKDSLAPYTYWYDHAPLGWIFIALWKLVAGDFFDVGLSVNAGRIFMAVLHIVSTFLLYRIALHVSKRKSVAVIAALLFSLSPLAIVSHRRVLLDNIMVFWFLVSLFFATKAPKLRYMLISALTFAIAVLTKESAAAFFPAMVFAVIWTTHKDNRHFASLTWASVALLIISIYPLFALLKGELFPAGSLLGGQEPHVSLWDALAFHSGRGGGFFLSQDSSFYSALVDNWLRYDALFVVLGGIATLVYLFMRKEKWSFLISLFSLSYFLFIIRGLVLDWYVIPLLPLFALSIGLLLTRVYEWAATEYPARQLQFARAGAVVVGAILLAPLLTKAYIFTLDQTLNQRVAVDWTKEHITEDKIVLIDNYAFPDFNPTLGDITAARVHYYWKADTDPMIRYDVLNDSWETVDYILFTPALTRTIYQDNLPIIQEAYEKSHIVKRFNNYDILNEGYPVEIREVNNKNGTLRSSWRWYREEYITDEGQVIDRTAEGNKTTSEGQSYALLRAVWEDDREVFDNVLSWTLTNLKQKDTNLFAWLASAENPGIAEIEDYTTASDADEDIALALLFASKKWNDARYLEVAQPIINDIWEHEVVNVGGTYYLTAGTNLERNGGYLINPSYFSPAAYRIFAEVDKEHPWEQLAEDSYTILDNLHASTAFGSSETGLVPNWFIVQPDGTYQSTVGFTNDQADYYGFDAFRLYWRVALDHVWFERPEAKEYLEQVAPFFKKEWEEKQHIHAVYKMDGTPVVQYGDMSTDAGALAALYVAEPDTAIDLYTARFWPEYENGYWDEANKYYTQNWAWFATALYANNMPNLWTTESSIARE